MDVPGGCEAAIHSAFSNFILQKSAMSQNVANPLMFSLPNRVQSSFTLLRTSSLVTLSTQPVISIIFHILASKASNLLLSD